MLGYLDYAPVALDLVLLALALLVAREVRR